MRNEPAVSSTAAAPVALNILSQTLEQGQGSGSALEKPSLQSTTPCTSTVLASIHAALTVVVLVLVITLRALPPSSCDSDPPAYLDSSATYSPMFGSTGWFTSSSSFPPPGSPRALWVPDLTRFGVEPNPGPRGKHSVEEIIQVKSKLKKRASKSASSPSTVVVTNAPPISRAGIAAPKNRVRKSTYLSGEPWNPRSEMVGYFQTLCDPERFPPVRLGGETMVPTALTTLHQIFPVGPLGSSLSSVSLVVIPRVWNPVLFSTTTAAPYTYSGGTQFTFNASSVTTLQSLAAAARVVSCKVKIYSTSSATNDQGALTCGLCPGDPGWFSGASSNLTSNLLLPNSGSSSVAANCNQTSTSGYPITSLLGTSADNVTNAIQGFNEFQSEDWTVTVPLKDGASIFWLPQDPSSMIFTSDRIRQTLMTQANTSGVGAGVPMNGSPIQDPFFCIGLTGLSSTTSTFNVEVILNVEYTVTSGASNVIETRPGCMDSVQQFGIAKRVGGTLQNYVAPDPEASLSDKLRGVGATILKSGLTRASEFIFGSSDVGKAVTGLFM